MVSHVSRAGREDSKLVGTLRVLQSESGRWAGWLRGLGNPLPASSCRFHTPRDADGWSAGGRPMRCEKSVLDAPAIVATVQWQDLGPVLGIVRRRGGGGSVAASPMARAGSFAELRQRGVSSFSAGRRRGGGSAGGGIEQCRLWPFTMLWSAARWLGRQERRVDGLGHWLERARVEWRWRCQPPFQTTARGAF